MRKALRFIGELKRRSVYGVAVAYIVVGLGVLGAADVILDPLGLGDARPIIVIVTLLGFPLAMVLAWIYDLTPAGLVRGSETNLEGAESEAPKPASQNEEVSDGIVVLPFENLSPHKEDEYFSDGVTEDLIAQLYRIGSLRVISRTSAWQYKGSRVGAKQIAADLGVAYLLEGSVWRSGSRVRIVAQLIDARHDRHMWAETYDRELEDIFGIQSEVANRIASALHLTLSDVGGWSPEVAAAMGCAFVAEGREARGRETVDRMRVESAERYVSPVRLSLLESALSDHEAALDSLDEAVTGRATDLIWPDVHPGFDALRDHPRLGDVRRRIFADEPER